MLRPLFPVGPGAFLHDLAQVGATALRIFSEKDVAKLAAAVASYPFSSRPEHEGPRGVIQHFMACEEDAIPCQSIAREISRIVCYEICWLLGDKLPRVFATPLQFNDHLLLRYLPHEVGLSAHKDNSMYRNLIVSVTLRGHARFNIHPDAESPPTCSFATRPGMVVFMRAPGFFHEDIRPFHSITAVKEERLSLIFKNTEAAYGHDLR
jgi:hypothetical protein